MKQVLAVATTCDVGFDSVLDLEEKEKKTILSHKAAFARACQDHYISFTINENNHSWKKDLFIKESRFADLILISGELLRRCGGTAA